MITESESIPRKSPAYLFGESMFFQQFNEVDFYVEDTDQESLYFTILSKLLSGVRFDRIFPLGGKQASLLHLNANTSKRKSFYILDKDFDDLLGLIVADKRAVYIDRYSIENHLLENKAAISFIVSCKPTLTPTRIATKLDVEACMQESFRDLRYLCLLFFLVQKFGIENLKNTSMSAAQFTDKRRNWQICPTKIDAYKNKVDVEFTKNGLDLAKEELQYKSTFEVDVQPPFSGRNICGKLALDLFRFRVAYIFAVPCPDQSTTTYRLAEYCTFDSLEIVKKKMLKML